MSEAEDAVDEAGMDGDAAEAADQQADQEAGADAEPGERSLEVLEYLVGEIVDEPDAITVDTQETRHGVTFHVRVAPGDMGKVIGRRGRVVQSIRTLVRDAGAREGVDVSVEVDD
jgi:uncharacterized protein